MKKTAFLFLAFIASIALNAQEVITLSQSHNVVSTGKESPVYRPIGPSIRISIGVPEVITASYNYQVTPWFMVGGGAGYGMMNYSYKRTIPSYYITSSYSSDEWSYYGYGVGWGIPLYFETELRTPKYKWSAFFNLKIGATPGVKTSNVWKEGGEYYDTDYFGNAVYAETTIEQHPFFISSSLGFGYKNFSAGYGLGLYGGKIGGNIFLSYNILLKK